MAIRKIFKINDEFELAVLRKKSKPVETYDEKLSILIEDMKDTLKKADGAGLSAVQVGVLKRLFIIIDENGDYVEFINPVIIESSGENPTLEEGCLSVPGRYGKVKRPNKVKVMAFTKEGKQFTREFNGFFAKAICHESDHLDGILYIDREIKKDKKKK